MADKPIAEIVGGHEIFDAGNPPKRRLYVDATVSLDRPDFGRLVLAVKEQMARRIAALVLQDDKFFKQHGDGQIVRYWANAIVLTDDELAALLRKQFQAGIRHAQGFFPHG